MGAVICKAAKGMGRFSLLLTSCPASALSLALISCAGPMSDPLGKHVYQEWVAEARNPGLPSQGTPGGGAIATDPFVFRMKAVKDYEYGNYVTNLRRGTSWGDFGSDSVKIILDSLVALTGGTETKAALGAASAGVTGATASIKKNVLFDQSITTFITKMDALRLSKWNDILCKMGRCKDHPPAQTCTRSLKPLLISRSTAVAGPLMPPCAAWLLRQAKKKKRLRRLTTRSINYQLSTSFSKNNPSLSSS